MPEFVSFTAATFTADPESRVLTGILLPFGEVSQPAADPTTGQTGRFVFTYATVEMPADPADVILNYGHDRKSLMAQVGVATELTKTPAGVLAKFAIAETPEGDRILALAKGKVLRFFSAEMQGTFSTAPDGIKHSVASTVAGAAVVRVPAFSGAHITHVAASAAESEEDTTMKCTTCGQVHAEGVTECAAPAPAPVAFSAAEGADLMTKVAALTEELATLKEIKIPVGPASPQFEVKEEPIYRFSGVEPAPSGFDFATDLLAAARGDGTALERVKTFTAEHLNPQFAADGVIKTSDVSTVNQPTYRPDMFMGQAPTPASPLYDYFYKGGLANVTPFFWSKLDRANTTVGVDDHTEGTDPDAGDLATITGATVTPVPVSGKVHITREVSDQGGNPQVSGLIWSEFQRSFSIALETKTQALIAAAWSAMTALATIATGTSGINTGLAVEGGLIDLQFLADGFRFQRAFGHVDLYKALALAANSDGEKIYPILSPTNRDGVAASKFASLQIAGWSMYPAASLGASSAGANNSLVADPSAVHVWNSGLQRLDKLQETVEGWDLGCFAYFAGVVYDVTGLRKVVYTK